MEASLRAWAVAAALVSACSRAPAPGPAQAPAPAPALPARSAEGGASAPPSRSADASAPGPFLARGASASYHVTSTLEVHNADAELLRLAVQLPAPQTNAYQDVANLTFAPGSLQPIGRTDDRYALFVQSADLPGPGRGASFTVAYDVTLYDLRVDLGRVGEVPPYDKQSDLYRWNTGPSGDLVAPDDPAILVASLNLWTAHPDVLGYARAAYEYVAAGYKYLNPNTGMHPLREVLAAGGGDCGNLSSIFVSLLRARGIPARHLVAMRPDGTYHVWADFLLQGYGWVPVDVTYKVTDPSGDFFGKVALQGNAIIMDKAVDLTVDNGVGTRRLPLLQDFAWWYWSVNSSPSLTAKHRLVATKR